MEILLYLEEIQIFTLAATDTPKDKQKKFQFFLKYFVYHGEYKLTLSEIIHIRGTYADFNLTHSYKYNSSVHLLGYWTRHDIISSEVYGEYEFNKPHFMLSDDFDSETKNVFNSTKNISSKEEKVEIQNIENVIDGEKVK